MNNEAAEKILKRALKKIKKGWTYNTFARDVHFCPVDPSSSEAVKWCSIGAVRSSLGKNSSGYVHALCFLKEAIDPYPDNVDLSNWNDRQISVEPVIEMFEKAIKLAHKAKA